MTHSAMTFYEKMIVYFYFYILMHFKKQYEPRS